MTALPLRCACGAITGTFDAEPGCASRGVCYCSDCQAYGRWLGRDDVLNAHGGTEILQTWPARVRIDGEVSLLRLSAKGLHRWYAACCRVPLANSFGSPRMPFLGLAAQFVEDRSALEPLFGPAQGVQGRFAPGGCPPGVYPSASLGVIAGALSLLARGAWSGANTPHPVFGPAPRAVARVLTPEERAKLGG